MPNGSSGGSPNGSIDIEKILNQYFERFRRGGPGQFKFNPMILVAIVAVIWLLSGIYFVGPDEEGVVLRFGKAVAATPPGPHWHVPWPVERVFKPKVTQINKVEVGFRTVSVGPPAQYREIPTEALMLTGDENIVKLEFIVQYKIADPIQFLFRVRDPVGTMIDAAESAMREIVGQKDINEALTTGKGVIQTECQALLQQILDSYQAGIQVVTVKLQDVDPPDEVNDAFKDVISAQQDKESRINESKGYQNDVVPKARGFAAQKTNEAEGYKEVLIKRAEGESNRFNQVLKEYRLGKYVTRRRLYLETMERVLPKTHKIILDKKVEGNVLPYLPLNEMRPRKTPSTAKGGQ